MGGAATGGVYTDLKAPPPSAELFHTILFLRPWFLPVVFLFFEKFLEGIEEAIKLKACPLPTSWVTPASEVAMEEEAEEPATQDLSSVKLEEGQALPPPADDGGGGKGGRAAEAKPDAKLEA